MIKKITISKTTDNKGSFQNLVKTKIHWDFLMEKPFQIRHDSKKYPNKIFIFRENEFWFEYNRENGELWCSYKKVWSVFEKEYGVKHLEIQSFIKDQVEEHFNRKVVTPFCIHQYECFWVEEHFNRKVVTPYEMKS